MSMNGESGMDEPIGEQTGDQANQSSLESDPLEEQEFNEGDAITAEDGDA